MRLIDRSQFDFFEIKSGDLKVTVSRAQAATAPAAGGVKVLAPRLGIFRAPKEKVSAGEQVAADAVLGSIEVLEDVYPVPAGQSGRVQEAYVTDGAFVEYGQPLFLLAPTEERAS